jgi:hypothetical protein
MNLSNYRLTNNYKLTLINSMNSATLLLLLHSKKISLSVSIIDQNIFCPIGVSLNDLGKKLFAFSKLNMNAGEIISRLRQKK